jgi:hypothetical protein
VGLEFAQDLQHRLNELLTQLRFNIRATEFAFWSHWEQYQDAAVPAWVKDEWAVTLRTAEFKPSAKAKTEWKVLHREGMPTLAWRTFKKTEHVAK